MPEVTKHEPGTFCWIELATTDANAARRFYADLFDWTVNEIPMGENGFYYIAQKNGKDAAALYEMQQEMRAAGIPPNWMTYVCVTNADDVAEQAKSLGGTLMNGPFDVFDLGRMAVIKDPQGAVFAIWEPKKQQGVGIRDEDDTLCWNELHAKDVAAAKAFYTGLGWGIKESPEYSEWQVNGKSIGGMIQTHTPDLPSYWMPYFSVADCDAKVAKAQAAGAAVYVPAQDVPTVGRFAVLADPQGAAFAVIKLDMSGHM
jgi:predicted enzyme related to lactoylglutathione lyase